jgi:hypothetical protein
MMVGGKPHGKGKFVSNISFAVLWQLFFDGEWVEGKMFTGVGLFPIGMNQVFSGRLKEGKKNGKGILYESKGEENEIKTTKTIYGTWKEDIL